MTPGWRVAGWARVLLGTTVLLASCGQDTGLPGVQRHVEHDKATGDAVLVVDGIAVPADEVQALQRAGGLTARDALARLETEALLMAEATRRGYTSHPQVQAVAKQALAQAYLDTLGQEATVSDAQVSTEYARQRQRFQSPQRRACLHMLAPLPRDREPTAAEESAAREVAEQAQEALLVGVRDDYAVTLQPFQGRELAYGRTHVERVPLMPRAGLVKPFADALFGAAAPGPLTKPVRSVFGWHAVVLTEIEPERTVPLEQATPELRAELLTKARASSLTARVEELRATHRPEFMPNYRERLEEPAFDP